MTTLDQQWEVLEKRVLLEKRPWLRVLEQTIRLPDGRVIDDYFTIESLSYVSTLGVRPDGLIIAIEEYKHGPGRTVLKLPAGYMEPGEEPLAAAQRELREETGYAAAEWRYLGSFHDDGNRGAGEGHHFLALGLRKVAEPNANDLSAVRPLLLTPTELRAAIRGGRVGEAGTAAGMLLGLDALENNQHSTANEND